MNPIEKYWLGKKVHFHYLNVYEDGGKCQELRQYEFETREMDCWCREQSLDGRIKAVVDACTWGILIGFVYFIVV